MQAIGFKLSFKILLTESNLLYISTKWTWTGN